MERINIYSVAKKLLSLVEDKFDCEDTDPTEEESQLASIILDRFEDIMVEYTFVPEEELFDGGHGLCPSEDYVDDDGHTVTPDNVELDYKRRAVETYDSHPNWKFGTLRSKFSKAKYPNYIQRWRHQIKMGGTKYSIYESIEEFVMERFHESRQDFLSVHSMDIRRWALLKASEYPGFRFKASDRWVACFKSRNRISSRKIQKLVKRSTVRDMGQIQDVAEHFRDEIKDLLSAFEPNCVWNTDQTGFKYEIVSNRTLSYKGERTTLGSAISPKNKVTHSYTVQYIITYDGTIIPKLYVCLQEPGGSFGPNVTQHLFNTPNLVVVSSKSGKLSIPLVKKFLEDVVAPNISGEVLYILDNWTAQTDMELYNSRFNAMDSESSEDIRFRVKFVPENCTDIAQPLDTYFHRELKYLVKQFYYFDSLHNRTEVSELSTRNGVLKLQSLVHFLLSSPIFKDMVKYCWFSSGLWVEEDKPTFKNVKNICFQFTDLICKSLPCTNASFIECSWCRETFCFVHFYEEYHLLLCPFNPF